MERFDIAIIGSGPAGISAAITAAVRNKKVLLLGSRDLSEKMKKASEIQNYPGFPGIKGEDLVAAFQRHLDSMGIGVTEKKIAAVYAMGEYFALQAGEEMLEASAVILATGVVQGKALPGENENLGRGVSYCATCDAPLYRGKRAAVIGYSPKEESEAAFLSEICSEVLYFPVYAEEAILPEKVRVIREKVTGVEKSPDAMHVVTVSGDYETDGVFILREAIAPGQLVPGLATDGPHVVVNREMEANIAGVFACGDITGLPYQYIKAAGEGNVAALSAVRYLDKKRFSGSQA
uniref:Putative thioredoxin reductase n=1 Tax=uncultured bacterium Ad_139_A06_contig2 TaxID=1489304 RepID=A0A0B4N0F6_9BACT|nr:putative thioredoxin reductase [uncultured bacterium Ad_139_A06_contig2]